MGRVGAAIALAASLALAAAPLAAHATGDHHHRPPPGETAPYLIDLFPSTYRPLPREDTLVTHATILDGADHRIDDGDVLLRDGKVVAVGHGLSAPRARVIDAHGRWVTPGIIDIHSHDGTYVVPQTSLDAEASDVSELSDPDAAGTWIESAVNPQDPAFARALGRGVTTLQILPGSDPVFGGRTVVVHPIPATTVQAMEMPGAPWGLKMACGENPKTTDVEQKHGPTSRQGEIAYIRGEFTRARHYMHEWAEYLSGDDDDRPDDDARLDTLAAVLNGDIAVHMHCYRADEMAVMIDLSHDIGFRIAAFHHAVEGYKIAPLLAANHICAVVWSDWWGYKMEALDGIRANAAFIDAAGGCTMMHSDSPFLGQWLNIEAGKAAAAGRRAGLALPPEHVIEWLTANPAKALGLADRIGTLEPGKDADLVIWSGDPFSVYAHADTVFIDGAVAYDRGDPRYQPRSDFELGRMPEARP